MKLKFDLLIFQQVPVGDWFCPDCRPKEIVCFTPRKSRKSFTEETDSDASESAEEEEEAGSDVNEDR